MFFMQKSNTTGPDQSGRWYLNRQINLGVIIQLILLASLIVGSWMNLQRQLDLLGHDLNTLIETQRQWQSKMDELSGKCLSYEYRLRSLEKLSPQSDISKSRSEF